MSFENPLSIVAACIFLLCPSLSFGNFDPTENCVPKTCPAGKKYHCLVDENWRQGETCLDNLMVTAGMCPYYNTYRGNLDVRPCVVEADINACPKTNYQSYNGDQYSGCMMDYSNIDAASVITTSNYTTMSGTTLAPMKTSPQTPTTEISQASITAKAEANKAENEMKSPSGTPKIIVIIVMCIILLALIVIFLLYRKCPRFRRFVKGKDHKGQQALPDSGCMMNDSNMDVAPVNTTSDFTTLPGTTTEICKIHITTKTEANKAAKRKMLLSEIIILSILMLVTIIVSLTYLKFVSSEEEKDHERKPVIPDSGCLMNYSNVDVAPVNTTSECMHGTTTEISNISITAKTDANKVDIFLHVSVAIITIIFIYFLVVIIIIARSRKRQFQLVEGKDHERKPALQDRKTRFGKTRYKPSLEDRIHIYDVEKLESVNESEDDVTSPFIDIIDEHQIISNHEIVNDAKHEFHNTYDMSLTDGQIQEEESSLDSLNQWIDKSTVVLRDPYCREIWTDEHQIVLHHDIINDAKQKGPYVDFQLHITHDMSLTEGQITEEEVILDSLKQGIDINIQEKQKEMLSRICERNIKFRAIRLITVGAKKTGKTALCKLLFKDNPHNVMVGRRDLRTLNEKTRDLVEQFIQRSAPDRGDAVSLRFFCHDLEGGMQNLQLHTSLHVSEATYLVHYRIDEYKEKRKVVAQQIYDYLKMIQKEHVNVEGNDSAESRMPTFSPTFLLIGTDGKEQDLEVESFTSNLHQDIFSCGDKSFNLKHIILTDILDKTTIHNDVEDIIYTILNQAYRHKDNVVSIPGSWLLIENEIFKWKSPGKVIQMEDIRRCMEGISLDLSTNEFEDFMTYFSRTYHIAVVNKDMIPIGSLSLIYPSLIVDAFELKTSSVCFYCKQNLNATTDSFILRALDHLQLVDFGISEFSNIIGKHAIFKLNEDAFFLLCCTDSLLKMTLLTGNGCSTEERIELVTEALKGYHCFDCLDETIELFISNCPFIHSDDPHLITDDRLQYSCCSYFDESSSVVPWLKQTLTSRESSQEGSSVLVVPIFKRKIEFKPDCEIEDESMPTKEKIEYLTTNEKTFDLLDRMKNSSADMLFVYYCVEGIFEGYDIEGIALAVVGSRFPLATTAHCLDFYSYLLRNCNESTDSTKDSITNFEDAILHGDLTLQKENLQDLDTSLYQEQGWSSLHLASYIGDVKGCTILLESGHLSNRAMATQPEGQFDKGIAYRYALSNFRFTPTYPLLLAVFFRHIEVIYLLLEKTDDHDTLQYCLRLTEGLHLEKTVAARIYKKVCSVYSEGNLRRELFRNVTRHNEPLIGFIKVYDSNDPKKSVQFVGYCKDLMFTKHFRYCGIDIHIQNPWQFSEQLSSKRKYTKRCLTEIENANFDFCLKENSENLWTKHSNLNVITAAVTEDDQLTVLLLCSSKGFIPEKEDPFPKFLAYGIGKKLPVKVNEGHFKFDMRDYDFTDVRQENLCMGADIAVENENYAGSLGLFVELGQKKGFVTCCHVLFHDSIKTSGFEFDIASCGTKNVIQPSSGERLLSNLPLVCGKVLKAIFKADSSGKTDDDTCIDAALVEITDLTRIPSTGCFTVKKCHQFKKEGFDEVPTFSSGRSERNITRALRDKRLVKSGNTTGFTGGRFILYGSQIRYPCSAHLIAEGAVGNKQIFHGQYEVSGRTSEPFTLEGDSGAAVFLVEDDDSLHCIGIVIGHHHTDGGLLRTVVTPIEPVLKSLGLETYNICQFAEQMDTI